MPEYTAQDLTAIREITGYTPEQDAAFSWVALEKGDSGAWRRINPERLSFTEPGCGPGELLYGSLTETFRRLLIFPGSHAARGFAAVTGPDGTPDAEDARRKLAQWLIFLGHRAATQIPPA